MLETAKTIGFGWGHDVWESGSEHCSPTRPTSRLQSNRIRAASIVSYPGERSWPTWESRYALHACVRVMCAMETKKCVWCGHQIDHMASVAVRFTFSLQHHTAGGVLGHICDASASSFFLSLSALALTYPWAVRRMSCCASTARRNSQ